MGKLSIDNTVITEAIEVVPTESQPRRCKVTAVVQRSDNDDPITIWITLPIDSWNGRFLGISGGGYSGESGSQ